MVEIVPENAGTISATENLTISSESFDDSHVGQYNLFIFGAFANLPHLREQFTVDITVVDCASYLVPDSADTTNFSFVRNSG